MRKQTGRYSVYIRPFSYIIDLLIINLLCAIILNTLSNFYYHLIVSISWIIISSNIGYYEVYRYTKIIEILSKIFRQYVFFIIINFAFIGFLVKDYENKYVFQFVTFAIVLTAGEKLFVYYFLKRFRAVFGGNFRKVIIIGNKTHTQQLVDFFNDNPDYGYKLSNNFDLKENKKLEIQKCLSYVLENNIDEIYCAMSDFSNNEINEFIDFSDNNLKILKFLPSEKEFLAKNLAFDFYGYIPVVSLRHIPLDKGFNQVTKRIFDIIFSLIVIIGILSWLTPILSVLIKIESKGPVFFKQRRNGLNYKEFFCYKFRSMKINAIADIEQVSKNDPRITRIGCFIRKTSIDELPQFFNVLLGNMSVVGPRPHMVSHTEMYARRIDKFMVRHLIKPGITGLAQTKGYRGEVETEEDIIFRVKYDIFYLENWSLLLDLKIIFQTLANFIKGDKKAY